jgi:hypothetical protein
MISATAKATALICPLSPLLVLWQRAERRMLSLLVCLRR